MASIYQIPSGWRAQVRLPGQPSRSKVFKTQKQAKDWARQEEAKHPTDLGDGGRARTIADMVAVYRKNLTRVGSSKDTSLRVIEHYLGKHKVIEITTKSINDFVDKRRSERFPGAHKRGRPGFPGPATILQDLIYLKTMLTHAGALVDSRDAAIAVQRLNGAMRTLRHLRKIGDSKKRDRRPTENELVLIERAFMERPRAATSIPFMDIVLFAICTCLRLGEIVGPGGVRWEDYDPVRLTLKVRGRKDPTQEGGRDMEIPLLSGIVIHSDKIVDPRVIIERQADRSKWTGRIFPYTEVAVSASFALACDVSKIKNLTFHDLRHDGISRLFEAGYDIPQVAAVSGHKSWKNLQRYTHIRLEKLRKQSG